MSETKEQLSFLSDRDLAAVYKTSRSILKERGLLSVINNQLKLKNLNSSNKEGEFRLVGKARRSLHNSILPVMLKEDWSFLFNDCKYDTVKKDFYVYLHVDPAIHTNINKEILINGRPFYVGKGTGKRAWNFKRSKSHLNIINKLLSEGKTKNSIVCIFQDNLTEIEAICLESKLISFFGSRNEVARNKMHLNGCKGGWLVNSDIPPRPEWIDRIIKKG